jgi:leader peptidase (prepilin peptidase)/N-methyltransferase
MTGSEFEVIFPGLVIFLLGLVIGSFLNVCIYRIPEGKSIIAPPSHCPKCGTRLKPPDLIPVIGYLLLKGRCRYCRVKISPRYAVVEMLTGFIFLAVYLKYSISVDLAAFLYLMAILTAMFFIDLDHKIIPDELVIAGLAGGFATALYNAFRPLEIYGDTDWWNPLLGLLPGSGILLLIALAGVLIYRTDEAMGMGDVKIFAPIGLFLGWRMCALALLLSILLGGLISLALMISGRKKRKDTIPFGPFIVIGTFITILWGWDMLLWYMNRL